MTGLTTRTVYETIRTYKIGGMKALKSKICGRKSGKNRKLT